MTTQESSGLLGRDQAALRLGCSLATLDRLVRRGDLPVIRFDRRPRFRVEDIDRLVERARLGK